VLDYHADGLSGEFFSCFDMDYMFRRITCPVLVLRGDLSCGGVVTDEEVEYIKSLISDVSVVKNEDEGHLPGFRSWNITQLIRAVSLFLESQ